MDCWQKILKDEGPRAFFKVHFLLARLFYSLFLCRATLQTCSGQLDARSCWSGTTSASLCWRPTSNRHECHTPPITSDLKTIIDHVISRSCGVRIEWYHIKIMSSLHHATHLKTSDFSLSFWSERIYISSGRTEQYWQTQAYFLALVEKYALPRALCLHQIVRFQSNGINSETLKERRLCCMIEELGIVKGNHYLVYLKMYLPTQQSRCRTPMEISCFSCYARKSM